MADKELTTAAGAPHVSSVMSQLAWEAVPRARAPRLVPARRLAPSSGPLRRFLLVVLILAGGAAFSACGTAPVGVDTRGLVSVDVGAYQALPPPYGTRHTVITSADFLADFARALTVHHIALRSPPTTAAGCTGGVQYTVVLKRRGSSRRTTLSAYSCAHTITGNMSGDVSGFLAYLDSVLST